MKIFRLLPIAAIAALAVSCQSGGSGSSLSENATQTDSLMYYLAQLNAADYLRDANRDTTLKEASQKQAYLSGVRAGLAAMKDGDEAYNKGVMLGIQMVSQMISFSEQMDVKINKSTYINALSSAVMADTMPNLNEAQMQFRKVMQNIEEAKNERDKAASRESLSQEAASANLPKINDDLYGKTTATTDGEQITDQDEVEVSVKVSKVNGETVNIPLPPKGKLSNRRAFPEVLSSAILTLKSGETGEFYTTVHALLGARAQQMDLKPAEVLKLIVTPTVVPQEPKEEDKKK